MLFTYVTMKLPSFLKRRTDMVKKLLSLTLSVLMVISMVSVFCLPAFAAAEFSTSYNGTVISRNALLVTGFAYGKNKNDEIVEEWDGVKYTFRAKVNAFLTVADAFDYAKAQNIKDPDIIVTSVMEGSDLKVSAPAKIYAPNYKTAPFNEDKTKNAATGTGANWTENANYNDSELKVRNIVISPDVTDGTVCVAGFTFTGSILDNERLKSAKATTLIFENLKKNGNDYYASNIIMSTNKNTGMTSPTQKDVLTVKNLYIKKTSTQGLISSCVPAYTTFDGLWVDALASGLGKSSSIIMQSSDKAVFTIKNSNLRNFRRSDYKNNQYGLLVFEGRNGEDVYEGMSSAIVFDNNILHKMISQSGSDGTGHIIAWRANSYTDFTFTNNYFENDVNYLCYSQGYIDTSRFFYTSIYPYSNCEYLDCYGKVTVTGNTLNGCRLKFEITNNDMFVPFTLVVHSNFMIEDYTQYITEAEGQVPVVHENHIREGKTNAWLDFNRTTSTGKIGPYTFGDGVSVDRATKTLHYTINASDVYITKHWRGDGHEYSLNLRDIIKDNIGNTITFEGQSIDGSSAQIYAPAESYGKISGKLKISSSDGSVEEVWTLNIVVTGLDICTLYEDVKHGAWYETFVSDAYTLGIMNGTKTTAFEPNTSLSRAMTVTIIARMAGFDTNANKNTATKFKDVPVGKWYSGAVAWAVDKGITTGTTPTTFDPNANVTRQDTCVLLVRFAKTSNITLGADGSSFKFKDDSKIGSWAKEAVYLCQQSGIVSGNPDGTFEPKGTTTRAAASKIFSVFFKDHLIRED